MQSIRKYKSDAFEAIHSAADGMYRAGTLEKGAMNSFDESCLAMPGTIEPVQIAVDEREALEKPSTHA